MSTVVQEQDKLKVLINFICCCPPTEVKKNCYICWSKKGELRNKEQRDLCWIKYVDYLYSLQKEKQSKL